MVEPIVSHRLDVRRTIVVREVVLHTVERRVGESRRCIPQASRGASVSERPRTTARIAGISISRYAPQPSLICAPLDLTSGETASAASSCTAKSRVTNGTYIRYRAVVD